MMEEERYLCGVCAARLEGQHPVAWLALLLTATGLAALVLGKPAFWWGLVVLAGLAERYVAARIHVDAKLFARMTSAGPALVRLDEALTELRMAGPAAAGRPLPLRVQGALAWTRRHTLLTFAQAALAAVALGAR
jgi:hypothetical protein